MRVYQQWNDLQLRKAFGFGHNINHQPQNGDLALFCPACPQPGINLPDNWKEDKNQYAIMPPSLFYVLNIARWLYHRCIVVDSNFLADHMKMKNPDKDISLNNGLGY